ncbi:MAG: helix-turn-helix domain-containing protein, partial [Rhodobacteraceae bacterium]|nr:helix-turn-helix domain-containing protein [Paracoccaceae bacterium]
TTFYRWYDRYLQRGEAGLQDQSPKTKHVWNRIPDEVRRKVVKLALKEATKAHSRDRGMTLSGKAWHSREGPPKNELRGRNATATSPISNCPEARPGPFASDAPLRQGGGKTRVSHLQCRDPHAASRGQKPCKICHCDNCVQHDSAVASQQLFERSIVHAC